MFTNIIYFYSEINKKKLKKTYRKKKLFHLIINGNIDQCRRKMIFNMHFDTLFISYNQWDKQIEYVITFSRCWEATAT